MKEIRNKREFVENLTSDGRLKEPLTLAQGCVLYGLTSVTSLEGLTLAQGCVLYDLTSVTSLEGLTLAQGCELQGIDSLREIPVVEVTASEAEILGKIPVENVVMTSWHCGTTHCLAGSAQYQAGDMSADPRSEGKRLLPSVSHLFFAPTEPVRQWLKEKRWTVAQS